MGLALGGLLVWLAAGRSFAATAAGTIITNVATATMNSGFPYYAVYNVSYNATATFIVLPNPVVALQKWADHVQAGAGCTVTFQVCVQNQTQDTAWNVTITDQLPANMGFVLWNLSPPGFDNTNPNLGAPVPSYATALTGTWSTAAPAAGTTAPLYLRWVFPGIGPTKSACAAYAASIL